MILSAQTLRLIQPVRPFCERGRAFGMSYGVSAAGYDIRIAETMWLLPWSFRLASTVEYFDMPPDLIAFVCDKSTWARRGLQVFNTVIEPGWRGYLTLELKCQSWRPIRLEMGMPIAQVVFQTLDEPTSDPYNGKYQDQESGAQSARFERA